MEKQNKKNDNDEKNIAEDPIIKIEHLCKNYKMFNKKQDRLIETLIPAIKKHDVFKALDDFSLELEKGEVLGILGKMVQENQLC